MMATQWWQRLAGSSRSLGWWTLPVFLVVGLAGAVMAGALAVVFYSQQVSQLEAETRESREQLSQAVDDVEQAGEEALAAIEDEVEAVQEVLSRDLPVEDINTLGVVVVRALIGSAAPPPQQSPAQENTGQGAPDPAAAQQPSESGGQQPEQPSPTPTQRPVQPRAGVGFAVANDGPTTFFATSYSLVRDPDARAGVAEAVEITAPGGTFRGVVHSWDEGRDLALVRGEVGELPIPKWRSSQEPVAVGERLTVAGLTPSSDPVMLSATVGYSDVTALVADIPAIDFLRGAPVVDQRGNVVAVYTLRYLPYGAQAGLSQVLPPAPLLCERMLRNCQDLEAEPGGDG